MTRRDSKGSVTHAEHDNDSFKQSDTVLAAEIAQVEKMDPWSPQLLKLYGFVSIMFLCSTMHGYDSALMSAILVTEPFKREFGTDLVGAQTGLITACYQIGGVGVLPFTGPMVDMLGRRWGTFIPCAVILIGTIIQGTSYLNASITQYMVGRALLGAGVYAAAVSGPSYTIELSPPAYRGILGGCYNCCYSLGAILAAGVSRGCSNYDDNRAWLVPTWMQAAFPLIVCSCIMFFPESPRWLFTHGKKEEAIGFLIKYHGNKDPDSIFVKLQVEEFEAALDLDGSDKRWWDYRALFRSRSAFHRLSCNVLYSAFAQWVQGGLGYYIGGFYASAGIDDPTTVLDLNLGLTCAQAITGFGAASFYDRIPRRKIIIGSFTAMALCWVGIIVGTAMYSKNQSSGGAIAGITFYWIFQALVFAPTVTPMQALYPSEVLSYEQRGKGMAFNSLANSGASLVNQFGTPIGLEKIGYKVYIVWCCFSIVAAIVSYFVFPETKGFTLEELDEIFESKNPVKASITKSMADAESGLLRRRQPFN